MADSVEVWWEGWAGDSTGLARFPERSYYEVIREALSPQYYHLSDGEIDSLLESVLENMSPEEAEGFWNTVGNIVKKVGGVAAQVLPVAAPVLGTAFGGPLGGALGGMVGQLAGRALGGAPAPPRPTVAPPVRVAAPAPPRPTAAPPVRVAAPGPVPTGGSSATAQLMALIQNPALLQSLLGQVLGPAGRSSVPVGKSSTPAPFGAFMNALSALANQAAAEASLQEAAQEATSVYLFDAQGNPRCDLAVPEERARMLLEELRQGYQPEAQYAGYPAGMGNSAEAQLAEWFVEAGWMELPQAMLG